MSGSWAELTRATVTLHQRLSAGFEALPQDGHVEYSDEWCRLARACCEGSEPPEAAQRAKLIGYAGPGALVAPPTPLCFLHLLTSTS